VAALIPKHSSFDVTRPKYRPQGAKKPFAVYNRNKNPLGACTARNFYERLISTLCRKTSRSLISNAWPVSGIFSFVLVPSVGEVWYRRRLNAGGGESPTPRSRRKPSNVVSTFSELVELTCSRKFGRFSLFTVPILLRTAVRTTIVPVSCTTGCYKVSRDGGAVVSSSVRLSETNRFRSVTRFG